MKKRVLAMATLLAVGGIYWYNARQASEVLSQQALDYIPADTLLFSAQLTPFPLVDYLQATATGDAADDPGLAELMAPTSAPVVRFGAFLYQAYLNGMADPAAFIKRTGISPHPRSFFYTLGATPVLRIEMADIQFFWNLLDDAEKASGLSHSKGEVAGQSYRIYPLEAQALAASEAGADAGGVRELALLLAERDGMLSISLTSVPEDKALLETAFGLTKVSNPISATHELEDMIANYGLLDNSLSFINHQVLVRALVHGDNQLGQQLNSLFGEGDATGQDREDPFREFRTQECQQELSAIAANWPRTVMGLTAMNIDSQHASIATKLVVESKNAPMLAALQSLRGFLPAYVREMQDSLMAAGLGLDVAALAPALGKIRTELLTPSLQCEPMAALQAQVEQWNPAMLGMATAMADGIKGIGGAVFDYQLDMVNDVPQLKKLDVLLSLSAKDPQLLFNMAKPFVPELMQLDLSRGDVDLSPTIPPDFEIEAKLGLRGQNLVVYTGEKSKLAADALGDEQLVTNGLFIMSADYDRMLSPVLALLEAAGEEIPPELQGKHKQKMQFQMAVDVEDKGPVVRSLVVTRP